VAADLGPAVVGLVGVVTGGLLVNGASIVIKARERKQAKSDHLRLAAAEVITTYLHARSYLIRERRSGIKGPLSRDELFPTDRELALAKLFTLPGSEDLRDPVLELGRQTLLVTEATDDANAEMAFESQLAAIRELEQRVRDIGDG